MMLVDTRRRRFRPIRKISCAGKMSGGGARAAAGKALVVEMACAGVCPQTAGAVGRGDRTSVEALLHSPRRQVAVPEGAGRGRERLVAPKLPADRSGAEPVELVAHLE